MKTFKDYKSEKTPAISENENEFKLFTEFLANKEVGLNYLNEEENAEVDKWVKMFEDECNNDLANMDEGFLGKLIGGVSGFLLGPTIGKIIANALGVEKGVLYDMFTSRLVNTALGSAIGKYMTQTKQS